MGQVPLKPLKRTTTPKNYAYILKHSFLLGAWRALKRDQEEYQRWHQLVVTKYMISQMTRTPYELDHAIPFDKGGTNTADNILVVTKEFNRKKGKKELHPAIVKWFKGEE